MVVSFSLVLGSMLLALLFFIQIFASIGFIAGIPLTTVTIWLAVLCTFSYAFIASKYYCQQNTRQFFIKISIAAMLLFFSFMYISGLFYDVSYDGQVYHQEAINQLVHHWNPFQEYLTKGQSRSSELLNHYAKGPWLYAAALYTATGQIEQSKVFNFILMISAFLLTLSTMKHCQRFTTWQSVLFGFLLAFNPISIYQALSFYIDGQLASLLLCLLALSYRLVTGNDKIVVTSFIMSIALTVNIKFTGVVYVVVCIGLVIVWLWHINNKHLYRSFIKLSLAGLFIGICVIGYNPYITNTVYYGHPFYPLYGAGPKTMDIMTSNSPHGFMQMSTWGKLYTATFSMSSNQLDNNEKPQMKVPFTVAAEELRPFVFGADVRIGGFGPWFSGIVVLTAVIVLLLLIGKKKESLYGIGLFVSIMISVLINPECWWARYVPQLWLAPICIAAVASYDVRKTVRYLAAILVTAVVINSTAISYLYVIGNYYCTEALDRELEVIAQRHEPITVYFGLFTSNYIRFERWGIDYADASDDIADMSIEDIRYKSLTAVFKKPLLAEVFADGRRERNE